MPRVLTICLAVFLLYGLYSTAHAQSGALTFVLLNKKTDAPELPKETLDKLMEGHMTNINRLAQEKKLLAAGPFDGGGGIFILNTPSVQQASDWLSTDPAVKAQRWDVEIYPYTPRVGSVCLVEEPYQMTTYAFVRFKVDITKSTVNSAAIFFAHDEHLKDLGKTHPVVAEGIFGERDGGMIILKEEPAISELEADPGVEQGLLILDVRKLWIAKGAFCEK